MQGNLVRWAAPAVVVALAFAGMAALHWTGQHALADQLVQFWGVAPYHHPFFDMQGLLSALECTRAGIDAYLTNPCDPEQRVYDYPPLWTLLTLLPVTGRWLVPAGLLLDVAFVAALLLLPAARNRSGVVLIVGAVLSSATVFAMERANNDLVIFILAALAAALLARAPRLRLVGYGLLQLAGLLKYFPFAAMAIALREQPARFRALAAGSLAIAVLFALLTWSDLIHALQNIPVGSPFQFVFGASNVGLGLVKMGLPAPLGHAITLGIIASTLLIGIRLGLNSQADEAVSRLEEREQSFLLVGGFIVMGCYFAAQNINYRAVHILLLVPSLVALRGPGLARRYASLPALAVVVMWMDFLRIRTLLAGNVVGGVPGDIITYGLGFGLGELMWWWLAVLVVSLLTALLRRAPTITWAAQQLRRFSSRRLRAANS